MADEKHLFESKKDRRQIYNIKVKSQFNSFYGFIRFARARGRIRFTREWLEAIALKNFSVIASSFLLDE